MDFISFVNVKYIFNVNSETPEDMAKSCQKQEEVGKVWSSWAQEHGGGVIFEGVVLTGEEGVYSSMIQIPCSHLYDLPRVYNTHSMGAGGCASVGVGMEPCTAIMSTCKIGINLFDSKYLEDLSIAKSENPFRLSSKDNQLAEKNNEVMSIYNQIGQDTVSRPEMTRAAKDFGEYLKDYEKQFHKQNAQGDGQEDVQSDLFNLLDSKEFQNAKAKVVEALNFLKTHLPHLSDKDDHFRASLHRLIIGVSSLIQVINDQKQAISDSE